MKEVKDLIEFAAAKGAVVNIAITLNVPPVSPASDGGASETALERRRKPRAADLVLAALWKNPEFIGESVSSLAKRFGCSRSTLTRDAEFTAKYRAMCAMFTNDKPEGVYDDRIGSFDVKVEDEQWSE